jgi:CRP-like cAMP-binding protein
MSLTIEEKRAWLAKVPLFRGCSPEAIEQLAAVTAEFAFSDDQAIVQQGQVGNGLHVIISGGARIVASTEELARFGPGDFFGELSVIDQRPRTATARAIGSTVCLALASWDLMSVLEREPQLAKNLLVELASRLRGADEQLRH